MKLLQKIFEKINPPRIPKMCVVHVPFAASKSQTDKIEAHVGEKLKQAGLECVVMVNSRSDSSRLQFVY